MSKIYEALLRAEQDRIATDEKQPAAPFPSPSAQTTTPVASVDASPDTWPQPKTPAIATIAAATADLMAENDRRFGERRIGSIDVPPFSDHRSGERRGRADESFADASFNEEQPLEERRDMLAELGEVIAVPWNPSLEHLPALGERGSSVEQFRSLRSRMHEFRDLNTLKSILVSSGLPQEGKSFIAANVAISFARHKASRVLLIDGDMRRSSLHHLLGCTSEPGLSEYLSGKATLQEIMQRAAPSQKGAFLHHGLASLTFIGAGKDSNMAADLSGNYRFDELIKKVSPYFDWIVVDSSPVNLVADGVNLSRACDGVLLVARAGVTKYEVAQRALTELKASNILGFVLNAVPDPPRTGGYYGYGGYDTYDTHEDSGDGQGSGKTLEAAQTI
jgi:protein-tyrosine kinase